MAKRQPGKQPRLAVASRFRLDRKPDYPPAVLVNTPIDLFDETSLTWQQSHLLAGENSLRHRQRLEKRNHSLDPVQSALFPSYARTSTLGNFGCFPYPSA